MSELGAFVEKPILDQLHEELELLDIAVNSLEPLYLRGIEVGISGTFGPRQLPLEVCGFSVTFLCRHLGEELCTRKTQLNLYVLGRIHLPDAWF